MIMSYKNLKSIIENNESIAGKTFDIIIQILILLSLIAFSIDTLPDIDIKLRSLLNHFELFTVIIFSIEYLLRLIVADNKLKFMFSFYGIIDLLAVLPFYFVRGIDLRSIRVFRLLRLFRTFKLLRYNRAIQRFIYALKAVKEELMLFIFTSLILIYVSSVGIYYFENEAQPENFKSIFHSLWWAVATLFTVGYGDIYPITTGGKIFTSIILLIGVGIIAVPTALIASSLTKSIEIEMCSKQ